MATPAQRLIQDQNLNFLYCDTTPGGKSDVAKADKGGGLGRRKALNDISNSRKPSAFPPVKKDSSSINVISIDKDPSAAKGKSFRAPEKGKVCGRKALSDLTNSVQPRPKQVPGVGRKLNAIVEEAEERFLHNHHKCIKSQMTIMDKDYFFKSVGLDNNDNAALPSARKTLPLPSSKKVETFKNHSKMEELMEHVLDQATLCSSPTGRSPRSPKAPYMMMNCWEDESLSDLMVMESPKRSSS